MTRLALLAVLIAAFAGFFHAGVDSSRQFVDRDTAHFYYPLFWHERAEIHAGRVPLWNPLQNAGQPLAANPVASVFYPPKLVIYALPFALGFKLFLLAHFAWALGGGYRLARALGMGPTAATVVAVAFTFNGHVLYQIANVPFLISAAWLPWFMVSLERLARGASVRSGLTAALVLAMMVLGGDPQLAYACLLLCPLYLLVCGPGGPWIPRLGRALGWPLALAAAVLLLSAVQVLPTLELVGRSTRLDEGGPANWGHYSFHPWRSVELAVPWFFGHQWPEHRYWGEALFETSGLWTPSAYTGIVVLVLAATSLVRRPPRRDLVMWVLIGVGLVVSFGKFLPVYRWLADHLPGAATFRYPSKNVIWVVVGLAVLAGRGIGRLFPMALPGGSNEQPARPKREIWVMFGTALLLATGLAVAALNGETLVEWAESRIRPSPFYGPFLARRAIGDLLGGLLHGMAFTSALLVVTVLVVNRPRWARLSLLLVPVVAADLWLANRDLVVTHQAWTPDSTPGIVQAIRWRRQRQGHGDRHRRLYRPIMLVDRRHSGPMPLPHGATRMDLLYNHDVQLLENKNGMLWGIAQAVCDVTFPLAAHEQFLENHPQALDLLCAAYILLPAGHGAPAGYVPLDPGRQPEDATWLRRHLETVADAWAWYNPHAYPRAWFVDAPARRRPNVEVRVTHYETNEVRLELTAPDAGRVVLADTYYPGWEATDNGRPTRIESVHVTLRAVPVDRGTHTVVMRYRPIPFAVGAWVSGLTAVLLLGAWLLWLFLPGRRVRGEQRP